MRFTTSVPQFVTRLVFFIVAGITAAWSFGVRGSYAITPNSLPWIIAGAAIWLLVSVAVFFAYSSTDAETSRTVYARAWVVLTILVILWGAWIRTATVDQFNFQNDEYYHVNAAVGYIETGEYVLWDFTTQSGELLYERSPVYTWQVVQAFRLFGVHEWSARLPALLWGVLLLILLPLVTYSMTRSWPTAFFAVSLAAFDNGLIWSSTYTRMYSMFFVMVLVSVWAFYTSVTIEGGSRERVKWLAIALLIAGLSVPVHTIGLLLFGGMGFAALLLLSRDPKNGWLRFLSISAIASAGAVGVVHAITGFLPTYFITIRTQPAWEYLWYPFQFLPLGWLAVTLLLTACLFQLRRNPRLEQWFVLLVGIVAPVMTYFTFFADRYSARKYELFVCMFVFILIGWAWTQIIERVIRSHNGRIVVGIGLFFIALAPMTIPGYSNAFIEKARADKTHNQIKYHDYETAYTFIEERIGENEVLVTLFPRTYYLQDTNMKVITLPREQEATAQFLVDIEEQYEGVWIMWPSRKEFHLTAPFQSYVKENYKKRDGRTMRRANMQTYYRISVDGLE